MASTAAGTEERERRASPKPRVLGPASAEGVNPSVHKRWIVDPEPVTLNPHKEKQVRQKTGDGEAAGLL